jgi:hypothetical protein
MEREGEDIAKTEKREWKEKRERRRIKEGDMGAENRKRRMDDGEKKTDGGEKEAIEKEERRSIKKGERREEKENKKG